LFFCVAVTGAFPDPTWSPLPHTEDRTEPQGSITKSGSQHARRLLVEAAWHYRPAPRVGRELGRRQDGQPQHVTAISWQAQRRLHRTWQRLDHQRGKRRTIVAVAVARELAGFCWAVTTAD
jgi:transposase